MMNGRQLNALCGAITLCTLAACGGDRGGGNADAARRDTATGASAGAPDTLTRSEAQNTGAKALDTAAAAVSSGPRITINRMGESGNYLADGAGRPLYLYTADKEGQSACYDACAQLWPPMIALQGTPAVGSEQVQGALLGTIRRRDGSMQVTYNQHPLYYYQKDRGAGPPQGNDVKDAGGEWYLVTPSGDKAEEQGEDEKNRS